MNFQPRYDPTIANYTAEEMERYLYMQPFATQPLAQRYLSALQGVIDFEDVVDALDDAGIDTQDPKIIKADLSRLSDLARNGEALARHQDAVDNVLTTLRGHVRSAEYVKDAIKQLEEIE